MVRTDVESPAFESGSLVPVATYLVVISVLSALLFVSPGESPPPILGMAWGVFLTVLALSAFKIEGVSPRSILSSVRPLMPVISILVVFWGLYNLVALGLALGGVVGFEAVWSRIAAHPLPYLAALLSSLLFTAIPEELMFRAYFQQKFIAMAGGETRRAVVSGIVVMAVLFAIFHLPRWFLALARGVGPALVTRLLSLTLMGITYGIVYAVTRNFWLVAFFHATMNISPILVTVNISPELHFAVGVIESVAIISVVYLYARTIEPDSAALVWSQQEATS